MIRSSLIKSILNNRKHSDSSFLLINQTNNIFSLHIKKFSTFSKWDERKPETIDLVFLRHGMSTWNQQNIFIGMTDTHLTKDGEIEATSAGKIIERNKLEFDFVYTSLLRRSISTVWKVLAEMQAEWTPVIKDWRLNERNYGALVGRNKKKCVEEYGKDQVKRWRRSWDEPPPPMTPDNPYWPYNEKRYQALGVDEHEIPVSESLKDVTKRTSVFWDSEIAPKLREGKRLLIVGHENNLRSIIKRLDSISNENIIDIEIPRAIPLLYRLDRQTLKPIAFEDSASNLSGKYLCSPEELKRISERDVAQVYDLNVKQNLEMLTSNPSQTGIPSSSSSNSTGKNQTINL